MSVGDARSRRRLVARMARDVAGRYRGAGAFAFFFARGKLVDDPLFETLLADAAIPDATRLVDLGCGQALLAGWLAVAHARFAARAVDDEWPWPAPPRIAAYHGIDRSLVELARARVALAPPDDVAHADLATIDDDAIGPADVVTLFDVLHYLGPADQERLVAAVARSLGARGTLVLRVSDAGRVGPARRSRGVDAVVARLRGYPTRLHQRTLADWVALLAAVGLDADVRGVDARANALVVARPRTRGTVA